MWNWKVRNFARNRCSIWTSWNGTFLINAWWLSACLHFRVLTLQKSKLRRTIWKLEGISPSICTSFKTPWTPSCIPWKYLTQWISEQSNGFRNRVRGIWIEHWYPKIVRPGRLNWCYTMLLSWSVNARFKTSKRLRAFYRKGISRHIEEM